MELLSSCRLKLIHLTKQVPTDQNSTAWLKIERNCVIVDEKAQVFS